MRIIIEQEYKDSSLYQITEELYQEIIQKYGDLQGMYDACCGDEEDSETQEASKYKDLILDNPFEGKYDGYIVY